VDPSIKTLDSVIPIANDQYNNAFRVVGFPVIVYNKLTSGVKCSCHSSENIGSMLTSDGNMDEASITELLTGSPTSIQKYGYRNSAREDGSQSNDHPVPYNTIPPHFDNISSTADDTLSNWIETDETTWGSSGLSKPETTDSIPDDENVFGLSTSTSCPICFGTGFVGGFSTTDAVRIVIDSTNKSINLSGGSINITEYPNTIELNEYLQFSCILPFGAISVDAFKVWNLVDDITNECSFEISVNNIWVDLADILKYCDGRQHQIRLSGPSIISHIEIQFKISDKDILIELPRLMDTGNSESIDRTGDISVNITPRLPILSAFDIITDSRNHKVWIVKDCTSWNDNNTKTLGWDANLRVCQPMENYISLPIRKPEADRNIQHRLLQNKLVNRV